MTETSKQVTDWNTTDFRNYLCAEHKRLFGVDYVPYRGWQADAGQIGKLIGTKKKAGISDAETVKAFIDACFAEYKPTKEYPGINFSWMRAFRPNVWQRVQAQQAQANVVTESDNDENLEGWL